MKRALMVLLLVAGVTTVSGSDWRAAAGANQPSFEEVTCPRFVFAAEGSSLTCGYLTVPESREDPNGRTIRNFVTIATPLHGTPPADPILRVGRELNWADFPDVRFVGVTSLFGTTSGRIEINMDQRGTGYSEPDLSCPEVQGLTDPARGITLGTPQMKAALLDAVQACHDRLTADGVDLAAYNVAEMAADAEDLRVALGIDEWDLITRGTASSISFEIMRRYPDHVRAAVFDSPIAPDVDRFTQSVVGTEHSVRAIARTCRRDAACHETFPHVYSTFNEALERLEESPSLIHDEGLDIVVDDATAVRYLKNNLMDVNQGGPIEPPEFPLAVYDLLDHGWVNGEPAGDDVRWSGEPPLATGYDILRGTVLSEGALYSSLCHDDLPFVDQTALAEASGGKPWYIEAYADDWYQQVCDRWDVGQAELDPYRRLVSDIPTLLLVGQYDPFSPLPLIRDVATRLSRSWLVEFPTWSHNVFYLDCAVGMRDAWYARPTRPPDTSCLPGAPPIRFTIPPPVPVVPPDDLSRISTIVGNGGEVHGGSVGDGGAASQATIEYPGGLDFDANGNLYVRDSYYPGRVRKVDRSGRITTVVGPPADDATLAPLGAAADVIFSNGVAVDAAGDVYGVIDHNKVVKVDPSGAVATVAGTGVSGYSGDGGPATEAEIFVKGDIALDQVGDLFIAGGHRIREVDASGTITTIAGTGEKGFSGDGGPALEAELSSVFGIAVDSNGNVFFIDYTNHRIRRIDREGIITTIAGNGTGGYSGDGGPAIEAEFGGPENLWVGTDGNIYFADPGHNVVREIDTSGVITTIAGTGRRGFSGDDGPATLAELAEPNAVAIGPDGAMYIADSGNNRVRKVVFP